MVSVFGTVGPGIMWDFSSNASTRVSGAKIPRSTLITAVEEKNYRRSMAIRYRKSWDYVGFLVGIFTSQISMGAC